MKLSEVKEALKGLTEVKFNLPSGELVPQHFHVTEVGHITKEFIDCGGTMRKESVIGFQLWTADDHDHRLSAQKLASIIDLSVDKLQLPDSEVEVEYQGDTIGKYDLAFQNGEFKLIAKQTDCLAKDNCGIPQEKPKVRLSSLQNSQEACTPGSGCC
ncbi:DUF6428 family protein [Marivirga atlantica]|jgi:hypothetical protein|uniref:Uncharacterized protein n=1 Tax=Marivirga atlantica TaxID=1548457 RepID=A0A937ALT7_9BACT|nr:DUF6428 family protein [Marivirga atlantica]MBL0765913.1 hypothetical protein [Marivirga atlantica]